MGLDMYLDQHIYYGGKWRQGKYKTGDHSLKISGEFAKEHDLEPGGIDTIVREVAYWRKANAIHGWFIRQSGGEELQTIYVDMDMIKDLVSTVKDCLVAYNEGNIDYCKKHLPVTQGFFFGSYEYNHMYKDDLEDTLRQLEPLVKKGTNYTMYYNASW